MKRLSFGLAFLGALIMACGGGATAPAGGTPSLAAPSATPRPSQAPSASATPEATPVAADPAKVSEIAAAIDELEIIIGQDGAGELAAVWMTAQGQWLADNTDASFLAGPLSDYVDAVLAGLQAISEGEDFTAEVTAILALRPELADLAPPVLPSGSPSAGITPAEAVANLKEWLPEEIKSGSYQVDRWYKITITTKTITVNAQHSNWVRDIIEADAFDMLFDIIGNLPADSTYRPTIVIQLRSGLDTSYLKVTTAGKYLDSIYDASDPATRWRKVSKFQVSGTLY